MASISEIARGNLGVKIGKGFGQAELFWEARTSDSAYKSINHSKWNEGTLWIGRPSLNGSPSDEPPVPIAGYRINSGLVLKGYLSKEADISDSVFMHAHIGDFWIFKTDAEQEGQFKKEEFRAGDILLVVNTPLSEIDNTTGEWDADQRSKIEYVKIGIATGYADDIVFKDGDHNWYQFDSDNVQDALLEHQIEKLQYAGEIGSNVEIPIEPVIGGLYLVTADDIVFNGSIAAHSTFTCDKGDFVFYTADTIEDRRNEDYYWHRIPSGYTNADEIDYYDADRKNEYDTFVKGLFSTFTESHLSQFKDASANVHAMLDFLMARKAQLDEQGKIPLSQLHDTVLGALQFKGEWTPVKAVTTNDYQVVDGKTYISDTSLFYPLPGYANYADGDSLYEDGEYLPRAGDYYLVSVSDGLMNIQYEDGSGNVMELNTGDWIVYAYSDAQDGASEGTKATTGRWIKIDNSDRLTQMSYIIDSTYQDNFWTIMIDQKQLNLVGNPILSASHKVGLVSKGNNTVEIVGHHLIDQIDGENSIRYFHPRYVNATGTVENSFIEDVIVSQAENAISQNIRNSVTKTQNITRFWSNVEIGKRGETRRDASVFGDFYLYPKLSLDDENDPAAEKKSIAHFVVNTADGEHTVSLVAPDGSTSYGVNEDIADATANIILPEHTSTVVGKLAGVELQTGRIVKSTEEGYIESTSIEEHMNADTNTVNFHDSVVNVSEFHSQVSTPVSNLYEIWFGSHDTSGEKKYTDDSFTTAGLLSSELKARLTKNTSQTASNIYVMLPADSGTLLTQENLNALFGTTGYGDDSYMPMFGDTKTLDDNGRQFDVLQKSSLRFIQNALRTRLSHILKNANTVVAKYAQESMIEPYAPSQGDGTFKSSTDPQNSDIVSESNIIAGKFNAAGELVEEKTIMATKALGVGNDTHSTGMINAPRTNYPDAPQYYNPLTGEYNPVIDVQVDMPNESGVLLTNNSLIDGGLFISS